MATSYQNDTRAYWRSEDYRAVAKFLFDRSLELTAANVRKAAIFVFGDMNPGSINSSRLKRIQERLNEITDHVRVRSATPVLPPAPAPVPAPRPALPTTDSVSEGFNRISAPSSIDDAVREVIADTVNQSNLALEASLLSKISVMLSQHTARVQSMLDRQTGMMQRMMDELGLPSAQAPEIPAVAPSTPVVSDIDLTRKKILIYGIHPSSKEFAEAWLRGEEGKKLGKGVDIRYKMVDDSARKIDGYFDVVVYFTGTVGKNGSDWLKAHCKETFPITGSSSSLVDRLRQLLSKLQIELKK